VQQELSALEQETVDTNTLNDLCLQLVHPSLTLHKDKSVKASTACCLADTLRLYAPNAPYTADELKVSRDGFNSWNGRPSAEVTKEMGADSQRGSREKAVKAGQFTT